jgi:hypothetical protein
MQKGVMKMEIGEIFDQKDPFFVKITTFISNFSM